ncbi:hypothetical protein WICPIJ_000457 [Wickerhamomyces pijperi]|uniref:DUF3835 domain-containing protein n=1 Tax=Wickerhamomyces pijperi TaxID=599730 RepID=A0A9P8QGN8_WICPI|nr:hypothetical protein WICPIJ_000457 [Wickerhamomyces pijperi]
MSQIEQRINQTIENLIQKRKVLQGHLSQYKILKNRLEQWENFEEDDSPEITVSINQRGRVAAHVQNPRKILAFLGSDYFVERDPLQALEIVERKTKYLKESISDFDTKIKEARSTLNGLQSLIDNKGTSSKDSSTKHNDVYDSLNDEDSFPLMDIREELDEDGNVISSSIKESHNEFRELMNDGAVQEVIPDVRSTEITVKASELEVNASVEAPKIEELDNGELDHIENIQSGEDQQKEALKSHKNTQKSISDSVISDIVEKEDPVFVSPIPNFLNEETNESKPDVHIDEFFTLFEEMKIIDHNSGIPSHINRLRESIGATAGSTTPVGNVIDSTDPTIEAEDILQLQLIADDFDLEYLDDDEDYEEEGAYDRSYYYEDDEDEDYNEEAEDQEELTLIKEVKYETQSREPTIVGETEKELPKSILKHTPIEKSKSVSFSSTLHIKEIPEEKPIIQEDIAPEATAPPKRVSKFKQRAASKTDHDPPVMSSLNINHPKKINSPTTSTVIELNESRRAVEDIIEREAVLPPLSEPAKEESASEVTPQKTTPPNKEGTGSKRDIILSDSQPLKLSKFKQKQLQSNKQTATVQIQVPATNPINTPFYAASNTAEVAATEDLIREKDEFDSNGLYSDSIDYGSTGMEDIMDYLSNDVDDEDDIAIEQLISMGDYQINPNGHEDEEDDDDEEDTEDQFLEDEDDGPLLGNIVENEEVEDPLYVVDSDQLEREYLALRERFKSQFISTSESDLPQTKDLIAPHSSEQGKEFEPIDEHGNPVKVSRFKKALNRE